MYKKWCNKFGNTVATKYRLLIARPPSAFHARILYYSIFTIQVYFKAEYYTLVTQERLLKKLFHTDA